MADWILVPCLVALRSEFNRIAPRRGTGSDGSIGDTAHQHSTSDHNPDETGRVPVTDADSRNEVHAIDVDKDLNESDLTMEKVVQFLLGRCRSGKEKRLRYIIWNKRIWSASSGWVQKAYTGASPHSEHAHFSASYDTAHEASVASWHLEDIVVAVSDADMKKIAAAVWAHEIASPALQVPAKPAGDWLKDAKAAQKQIAGVVTLLDQLAESIGELGEQALGLTDRIGDEANPGRTIGDVLRDVAKLRGYLVGDPEDTENADIAATAPVSRMNQAAEAVLSVPEGEGS